jgi:hypothetical protein
MSGDDIKIVFADKINGQYELVGFKPGDPIKMVYKDAKAYGRVDHTAGGIVYLRTPGGSLIKCGSLYVEKIKTKEDFEQLDYWDKESKKND